MIIGITGRNASGKGEVADILKGCGLNYLSISDEVREEVKVQGLEVTRENLISVGRETRKIWGVDVFARRCAEKIEIDKNYAVDSFRHPSEVLFFRKFANFTLIEVSADPAVRFERIRLRDREKDPVTFEEFLEIEQKELGSGDRMAQQLIETARMADIVIENNGSLDELKEKVLSVLREVSSKTERPDWDDYFMQIASVVSLRSNCLKRRVAAIIVKEKRIISTGYNGTPRGVKNCNEGGCPRCWSFDAPGRGLSDCVCSHAEENAIVQAAYHGVSVKGGVLYSTYSPCLLCTKMIINSGISEVVYRDEYCIGEESMRLLKEAGIAARKI